MEFIISISRPEKSWNLSEGHGKALRFPKTKRQSSQQQPLISVEIDRSMQIMLENNKMIVLMLL